MPIKLPELLDIPPRDWRDIALAAIESTRDAVQRKKVLGRKHKYSARYKKAKKAGTAAPKGVAQASNSGVPDCTLTGKTMAAFHFVESNDDGFVIGWHGNAAEVIRGLAANGLAITTDAKPLLPKAKKEVDKLVTQMMGKRSKQCYSKHRVEVKL